jgi:predicted fused transcriptional regulator/phosphomethylpyrimidine kinase
MGRMTNDMCRLRGEIGSLHQARETFLKDLEKAVSEMQANFAFSRTARARRMKADLMAFTTRLRKETGEQVRAVRTELAAARHAWRGTRAFRAAG